jgi:hypothetical protein
MGKFKGKHHFGGPRHRREDNIDMDVREIGCQGVDWVHVAKNR